MLPADSHFFPSKAQISCSWVSDPCILKACTYREWHKEGLHMLCENNQYIRALSYTRRPAS